MSVEDTILLQQIRTGISGLGTPTIAPGDVEIGAVEIKDGETDARAKVVATNAAVDGDIGVVVAVPGLRAVIGATADAVDLAGGATTLNAKTRGLVQIFADIWNSVRHSFRVEGPAANAAAIAGAGNPELVAGSDGANIRTLSVDTTGRAIMVGAAGQTATPAGSPVLIGGVDPTVSVRRLLVTNSGALATSETRRSSANTDFVMPFPDKSVSTATNPASGAAGTVLTPTSGKKFRLWFLSIAVDVAGSYHVRSGTTVLARLRLPAGDSRNLDLTQPGILATAANDTLNILNNTGGAANIDATALYGEE